MSGYIADLLIKVDSSEVESATQKLKDFLRVSEEIGKTPPPATPKPPAPPKPPRAADPAIQAAKDDKQNYRLWLQQAAQRTKDEATEANNRLAILANESKARTALAQKAASDADAIAEKRLRDSNKRVEQQQNAAKQADKGEEARYAATLKQGEKLNKESQKQQAAIAGSREQYFTSVQGRLAARAKESADAEVKARKDALKELQSIDRIRLTSTLRRVHEEEQAELNRIAAEEKARAKAEQKRQSGLNNVASEFDPGSSELKRLNEKQSFVKQNQSSFTPAEYERINKNIDVARQKVEKYGGALGRTSLSAKQLQLAQQGLPAQFTDIIVSLQGGQAPLTVLLQQGGQIKDMFGGVGPAIKGVGSAIFTLINPATILFAVMAGFGAVFLDAEAQLSAFNAALFKGNEVSGASALGLAQIAADATIAGGSLSTAGDAIKALAATGGVAASRMGDLGRATQALAVTSGKDIDDVAKAVAGVGDKATETAEKLSKQFGIVTLSQYETIKALDDAGRSEEALDTLSESLNKNALERLQRYRDSLSLVERDWMDIKAAISDAYGAVRAELFPSENDELKILQRILKTRQSGGIAGAVSNGLSSLNSALGLGDGKNDDSNEAIAGKIRTILAQREAREKNTKAIADQTTASQKLIETEKDLFKQLDNSSKGEKKNAKLDDLNTQFKEVWENAQKLKVLPAILKDVKFDGTNFSGGAYDTLKASAEKKFKEKAPKVPKSATLDDTEVNDLQNKVTEIKAQYGALNEAVKAQQEAGTISLEAGYAKRQQLLTEEVTKTKAAYGEQITALEALKGAKNLSANQSISLDRKIADARSKMTVAELEAQKALDKSAEAEKKRLRLKKVNVDAYNDSLKQMIDNLRVAGERDRAGLSQTNAQRAVSGELNSEDDRYNNEVRQLNNQRAENPELANEVGQKLDLAAKAHTSMKDQILKNYEEMSAAQKNWGAGIESAFKQYIEDGQNYAGLTNQAFTNAFSSMEDAIVSFVTTGKGSFADLTKSILADMARIAIKSAASGALQALFGAGMAAWGGSATSAGSTAAGYNNLAGWGASAKGSAWTGGTQFFAKGGAFTNSVVSKPTAFSSNSSSKNIMGEAGPEAIMPLSRGSDGSLGVRAQVDVSGLQQQSTGGVNVYIDIASDGKTSTSSSDPGYSSFGNEVGQFVDQRYRQLLSKDLSPGGDIWKSMQG